MALRHAIAATRGRIARDLIAEALDILPDPSETFTDERAAFVAEKLSRGGRPALARIQRYGRTEDEEPLDWFPWFAELVEAIADYRISELLTTGNAQCGKTLANTLVAVDTAASGRCQFAWFYAAAENIDLMVPDQYRPIADRWVRQVELDGVKVFDRSRDRLVNARYEVERIGGIFSFANTSKNKPSRSGKAKAGGKGVSFPADCLFYEEKSQWETDVDYTPRMNASCLPTRPVRQLGTPGAGGGIEADMTDCDRYFYPHYECPHCGAIAPLNPKGCLLRLHRRTDPTGKQIESYLSPTGRPVEWFHHDPDNAIASAYIGCSHCFQELSDDSRLEARFRCLQTGIALRDFLDGLGEGVPAHRLKVGMHLSPLVKVRENSLAVEIIEQGFRMNAEDWQQQILGFPSETLITQLSLPVLRQAIAAPRFKRIPVVRLAGVDQGRGQFWYWVSDFAVPPGYKEMPIEQAIAQSVQTTVEAGAIMAAELPYRLEQLRVNYGLIDNEPDRTQAGELARLSCVELADQRTGLTKDVKLDKVYSGGKYYDCWLIENSRFLKAVLLSFLTTDEDGYPTHRLPDEWESWVNNPSERSPLKHLVGPSYDPNTGKWERGPDHVDDLYYACMFVQAAFYLFLTQDKGEVLTPGTFGSDIPTDARPKPGTSRGGRRVRSPRRGR